jgi:transcriptional regulator with XRE-family HTH domain
MPIKEGFRRLRLAKGMTQQDLANVADLALSVVVSLEAGRVADPRISTLQKIARALGVGVDDLAGEFGIEAESEPEERKKPRKRK